MSREAATTTPDDRVAVARGMGEVTVTIPMALAGRELSKNGRAHWRVVRRAYADQRDYAYYTLVCAGDEKLGWPAARMDVVWAYARGKAIDDDNAFARVAACRDAFQLAGIVADDQHISMGDFRLKKVKTGQECVTVTLRKEEAP